MSKKVFLLAAIAILFSGSVYADDPRDANYWNIMDMGQKQ
jgi:high-affinity Fe2+/Pb2+ permease